MDAHRKDDPVTRELRRFVLARRLLFHQVRTRTIGELTGLSRHRVATLRRRLIVPKDARHRGPPPSSLELLLRTFQGRTEGAALAALFSLFETPTAVKSLTSLDEGEQQCEIYEAYLAYYPQSNVQFEELMLLKKSLAKQDLIEIGLCRVCGGLIMNNRDDLCRSTCWHCEVHNEHDRIADVTDQGSESRD
jgi:hypothetical protein